MDHERAQFCAQFFGVLSRRTSLVAVCAVLLLSACDKGPPGPEPPTPPLPQTFTVTGYVITAELRLSARPEPPSPGMM